MGTAIRRLLALVANESRKEWRKAPMPKNGFIKYTMPINKKCEIMHGVFVGIERIPC